MHEIKNELCPKVMLDLFKKITHPYNLRNGLICGSYKIKTVCYGTETITCFLFSDDFRGIRIKKIPKKINNQKTPKHDLKFQYVPSRPNKKRRLKSKKLNKLTSIAPEIIRKL